MFRKILTLLLLLAGFGSVSSADDWDALELLGRSVDPSTKAKFPFIPDRSFEASYLNTPVFVARGAQPGPTLCITAGVHGDELNGVEVARRAFSRLDPTALRGTLIVLPSVERCNALVDLHTASNNRTNLPQIRADISDPDIRELAVHFGLGIVVAGQGPDGSLRREAAKSGIPAIIYEAGEPHRFQEDEVNRGVEGVENVMAYLEMTGRKETEIPDARVYERTRWIRVPVNQGGFFFPSVRLGDVVEPGQSLGQIVDPFTDASFDVASTIPGEILGIALPQPVLSGYALFHVAWQERD